MKTKTFTNNDGKRYTVKADYFDESIINQIINLRYDPEEPGINVGWMLVATGSKIVPDGTTIVECVISSDKMKTFRWSMGLNKGKKFSVAGIFHKQS